MDLHSSSKLVPDPHSLKRLDPNADPDPHKIDADPKRCPQQNCRRKFFS
jgi:hypothetical protein